MIAVVYPEKKPAIRIIDGAESVFCMIRKKWFVLTPEEWVRQNFLLFLTETMQFPCSLIAVEKQVVIGDVKRRFDIVVFDRNANPYALVECKEMGVVLTSSALMQALHYHSSLQTRYLLITNGNTTYAYEKIGAEFIATSALEMFA